MAAGTTTLQSEIQQLERDYWEASKKPDRRALERLTAPEFTIVMEDGVNTLARDDFINMVAGDQYRLNSFSFKGDMTVRELSPGVALCAYRAKSNFQMDGKTQDRDSFFTAVWIRKGGSWELAAEAETVPKR